MSKRNSIVWRPGQDLALEERRNPMMMMLPACLSVGRPIPRRISDTALLCLDNEHAKFIASSLDHGQVVLLTSGFLPEVDCKLSYRTLWSRLPGDIISNYRHHCPPGKADQEKHDKTIAIQTDFEQRRHAYVENLVKELSCQTRFFAVVFRYLKRPQDYTRSPGTGTALFWGLAASKEEKESKVREQTGLTRARSTSRQIQLFNDAAESLVQEIQRWLVKSESAHPDYFLSQQIEKEPLSLPEYDRVYRSVFQLAQVLSTAGQSSSSSPDLGISESDAISNGDPLNLLANPDGPASSFNPSEIVFRSNGEETSQKRALKDFSRALERGNGILVTINKEREFDYTIHKRPGSQVLNEAWTSWKFPFQELSKLSNQQSCRQGFRRALPAWMHGERDRYVNFVQQLADKYKNKSMIALYRMMQQPEDLIRPAIFGDILVRWLPMSDSANHHMMSHYMRLLAWMSEVRIEAKYSRVVKVHTADEVMDYSGVHQKCFYVRPRLHHEETPTHPSSIRRTAPSERVVTGRGMASTLDGDNDSSSDSETEQDASPMVMMATVPTPDPRSTVTPELLTSAPKLSTPLSSAPTTTLFTPNQKSASINSMLGATLGRTLRRNATLRSTLKKISFRSNSERLWAESQLRAAFDMVKQDENRPVGPECMTYCMSLAMKDLSEDKKCRLLDLVEARLLHDLIEENLAWINPEYDDDEDSECTDEEDEDSAAEGDESDGETPSEWCDEGARAMTLRKNTISKKSTLTRNRTLKSKTSTLKRDGTFRGKDTIRKTLVRRKGRTLVRRKESVQVPQEQEKSPAQIQQTKSTKSQARTPPEPSVRASAGAPSVEEKLAVEPKSHAPPPSQSVGATASHLTRSIEAETTTSHPITPVEATLTNPPKSVAATVNHPAASVPATVSRPSPRKPPQYPPASKNEDDW